MLFHFFKTGPYNMHAHMNRHNTGYEVVLANTAESKKIHFNLRYQIYCIEKGFEEAKQFPDEQEKDEYDDRAVHFLIRHKADQQWVGTFRLIIDKFDELPISQHAHIDHLHRVDPQKTVVEFSRLGILRPFQKHSPKIANGSEDADLCIVFNAISAGIEYSRKCGTHKIYFLCRPSLSRIIGKMGIKCPQIGDKTLYRGIRYPYKFDLADFPLRLFATRHALQEFHRKNTYLHYCQASDFEGRQLAKAAA
jgi:N-acyl amino acid synthase of PEP-CTERM/exosortase system